MNQEHKQLLLKDLCARLPYGVKVCARFNTGNRYTTNVTAISVDTDYIQIRQNALHVHTGSSIEDIRPYLRPMSSMTEEERKELSIILNYEFYVDDDFALAAEDDRHRIRLELCESYIDWLNAHYFDYRNLIGKGLALEAPEGMYES